jgi:VanZ family protein
MTTFFFSTDVFSANETSKIIVPALRFFFPTLSHAQIDFWHIFIRKCGHVSEYLFLTMLAFRAFKYEEIDPPQTAKRKRDSAQPQELFRTMMFVVMAASLDEWHQSFTASRGASVVDVGYDCVGGVLALWLIKAYETWRIRSHSIL